MEPEVPEAPDDDAKKGERRRDDRSKSADRPAQPGGAPPPGEEGAGEPRDAASRAKKRGESALTQGGSEPRQDPAGPRTTREQPDNTNVESE